MRKLIRIVLCLFVLFFLAVFFLSIFGGGLLRIIGAVAFGWLEFLKRVIPKIEVSWSGVGMFLLCSILIVAGLHYLLAWFHQHRASTTSAVASRWRWPWSLALYVFLWLLFLAAMGVTGFTHQLSWLLASNEPWTVERKYRWHLVSDLKQAAIEIRMSGDDAAWDIGATQKAFFESDRLFYRRGTALQEELQVLFIPDSSNRFAAAVLFYRDPDKREKAGLMVVERQNQQGFEEKRFTQLAEVLAQYGNR